ncbi:hypothetical protein MMC10_002001 [Thelotrema lepadinum]|nr:hypothetical protein [Thelotrema lepadinum]
MVGTLAVVSQTGQSLNFFDIASGERTSHITSLTAEPHELCRDPKRNVLYVSHVYRHGHYWAHEENAHEITVVDLETRKVASIIDTRPAKAPHGLAIDHQRDILYVSVEELPGEEGGGVIGIDLNTRETIKRIPSQFKTHWFTMTPDGKKAYTCNKHAPFISVLDLENERMIGKIKVLSSEEPSMSPGGRYAYFPTPGIQFGKNAANPEIQVIDTAKDAIVESIPLKNGAQSVHVGPLGTLLVAEYTFAEGFLDGTSKSNSARLAIYEPRTWNRVGEVEIGLWPLTIRCTPDEKTVFMTNIAHGTVSVIDLASKTVVRTLEVDTKKGENKSIHVGAHGMAVIP